MYYDMIRYDIIWGSAGSSGGVVVVVVVVVVIIIIIIIVLVVIEVEVEVEVYTQQTITAMTITTMGELQPHSAGAEPAIFVGTLLKGVVTSDC